VNGLDLRPLSLGEILDRTFTIYRRHFVLFIGIAAIPQIIVLAFQLVQLALQQNHSRTAIFSFSSLAAVLLLAIVSIVAYLFAQGGTIFAISEIYLGRSTTILEALQRVRGNLGFLFGVVVLNGLAISVGTILLVIPGIYIACRLLVCVPVALIEERGPRDSLTRSWDLTKDNAGRAFMIFLLYVAIGIAANLLFTYPFSFVMIRATLEGRAPFMWLALTQVGAHIAAILTQPVLLLATSIFYYDLRVRKEAFDLQLMMNPGSVPSAPGSLPSIL
jgi:hypothetical protein